MNILTKYIIYVIISAEVRPVFIGF